MIEAGATRSGGLARRVPGVALAVALIVVLGACNWTQFRADAGHSGNQALEVKVGTSNVAKLTQRWTGVPGGAASTSVVDGVAFVGTGNGVRAFDVAAAESCSGTPKSCSPLWTATLGQGANVYGAAVFSTPAVADGVVYVGSVDGNLYAFDAAGVASCTGVPKTCAPLWTGFIGGVAYGGVRSSPTVVDGRVYVGSAGGTLAAFDAAGVVGCSAVPKQCTPLWTATTSPFAYSSPAVADGVLYIGSYAALLAFDASGVTSCGGVPKVCAPLWTAPVGDLVASPAVANGMVYLGAGSTLYAFDGAGVTGCTGVPKTCAPVWAASNDATGYSAPAIANGVVYIGSSNGKLQAFDAATGTLQWRASAGGAGLSDPAVANGVVYVGSRWGLLFAFDADGGANCSGVPKTCLPVWYGAPAPPGATVYVTLSPSVADGVVYVGAGDGKLHAFGLPSS